MKLAVYGSLKRGRYNHGILAGDPEVRFLGHTRLTGDMYLFSAGYPLLFEGENDVDAEVYEVPLPTFLRVYLMEANALYYPRETSTPFGRAFAFYTIPEARMVYAQSGSLTPISTY